jgi:Recombination endonuclease VII
MNERTCSVEGCDNKHLARGLCSKHYQRLQDSGDFVPRPKPDPKRPCSVDGCTNYARLKGMCEKHYHRMRRHGTTDDPALKADAECSVEGCTEFVRARGLCNLHLQRWYRTGSTDPGPIDPFRRCTKCDRLLPREQFPNVKRKVCEDCFPLYQQEQRAKQMKSQRNKKGVRTTVAALLAAQENRCAICGSQGENGVRKGLVLDHDHATGCIRGMLCLQCNSGLGQFRDSPELLAAAIQYLQEHRPDAEQLPLFVA